MRSAPTIGIMAILLLASCNGSTSTASAPTSPSDDPPASAAPSAPASAPASEAANESIEDIATATLDIDGGPDFPTAAFDSLWLLAPDGDDQAVVRVDPSTNETVARISIPGGPCQGMVATDDAIWFCTPDGASWIDPATNEIAGSAAYDVGRFWGRMAFGSGAVWSLGSDGFDLTNLVRIDANSGAVTTFPLGFPGGGITHGFDSVWVTVRDEGLLLRVDPASGEVSEHASGLIDPWTVFAGPDSLWVTLHGTQEARPSGADPTIARVDPTDGAILAEIATGAGSGTYGGVWAEADAVWVRAPDAFIVRIDPATNAVALTLSGPSTSGDVTVAFGSVWATAVERQRVYRLAP